MSRWIRLDTTWSQSDWLAELDPESRLVWVELLCYVKAHGSGGRCKRLEPGVFARVTGVTRDGVRKLEESATTDGALAIEAGEWVITGWDRYQRDQTAATRQRRYRESKTRLSPLRNVTPETRDDRNVTPTETKTETSTETERDARAREVDDYTLAAVRGLYGWAGREGTDMRIWNGQDSDDRDRLLTIACARLSAEGRQYSGRFFRAILESVIAEDKTEKTDLLAWFEGD